MRFELMGGFDVLFFVVNVSKNIALAERCHAFIVQLLQTSPLSLLLSAPLCLTSNARDKK